MHVLVTAGPTRQYIDSVRFITNASTGRMGSAVARAAARAGHQVTLLLAQAVAAGREPPPGCEVVPFVSVDELKAALAARFDGCDALVMAAAVGDFRPERPLEGKLARSAGPVTVRLLPTEDLLAGLAARKREGQTVVAFAVEDGPPEAAAAKARAEMAAKGADYVVANTPAAMGAEASEACILSPGGIVLPWGRRAKEALAGEIVRLLASGA
jgi:phosphopantothenoylcysteine decarboxylase/phosphopantothenate--cysteine ligase